ncbi:hypothetical protein PAPHI01_2379 [Pancytospora philotis]|nr:hypothetical protein PAPHI01_2379 [Pancytospora philotis]
MDRINSFLDKRPTKHRKILRHNGNAYEITKQDLKTVRAYRSRVCLDKTYVGRMPPDLRFSATPGEALPAKEKKDNAALYIKKAQRYFELHPLRRRVDEPKNAIVDAWEDDTAETLRGYRQEWVYSIKDQYNTPVEQCAFTREHLEAELRRVFLQQFRPREVKEKTIDELLPKLPDPAELRPFPEEVAGVWRLEGKKYLHGECVCAVVDAAVRVVDLRCGKTVHASELPEAVRHVAFDENGSVYASTEKRIYRLYARDGTAARRPDAGIFGAEQRVLLLDSPAPVKDFSVSNGALAALTAKTVNLYEISGAELVHAKRFVAKYENPNRVKIFDGAVHVSTANGLLIEAPEHGDIKSLNYVIDFAYRNSKLYVINNLNRLIVIAADGCIKKNIVQPQMGRAIRIHSALNLLAIMFSEEIGIYKHVGGEYVPAKTLVGRYKSIEWHPMMPWLYAGKNSKVVLYT